MKLIITLDGVAHELTAKPGDLVRFERQFDVAASSLDENARLEHVFFIAWCAMKRVGSFTGEFEDFIDLADIGGDPVPLEPPKPLT